MIARVKVLVVAGRYEDYERWFDEQERYIAAQVEYIWSPIALWQHKPDDVHVILIGDCSKVPVANCSYMGRFEKELVDV